MTGMKATKVFLDCRETVRGIVEECRAGGRIPMSALVDVATAAGCGGAKENHDYVGEWMAANGEPTFDKLTAWADGVDVGIHDACHRLAGMPIAHEVKLGDEFGVVLLEHRQSGKSYIVPYAKACREKSRALIQTIRDKVDPRSGAWMDTTYAFCHV